MPATALRKGLRLMAAPAAWAPGIAAGIFLATGILVAAQEGTFVAGRLLIIEFFAMPFLIGAFLGAAKRKKSVGENGATPLPHGGFVADGARYYFPVLLPAVVILFAIGITVGLLLVPFSLIGAGMVTTVMAGAILGVVIPFAIGTYFYDTAAVFEGRKALDSIRRSVEVALTNLWKVILFFVVNLAVLGVAGFILLVAWTSMLYARLVPIASYNATQLQQFTPADLIEILGSDGIYITAIIAAIGVAFAVTFAYSYKASFFPSIAKTLEEIPQGYLDEKGRWYKYS